MDDTWKILFHPFEGGILPLPQNGARVLFLGAEPEFRLPSGYDADLRLIQGFRPSYRALEAAGFSVAPSPHGEGYEAALVLAGRHRGQNELHIAEAMRRVVPKGQILVAGGKEDGIASLCKRLGTLLALDGRVPKYHGIAFWFANPADAKAADALATANPPLPDQFPQKCAAVLRSQLRESKEIEHFRDSGKTASALVGGRFHTVPGMFSFGRVDDGSRLLAENLPLDIGGDVADFAAGWGYLSAELLSKNLPLESLDLYEADYNSLEAARRNLARYGTPPRLAFFWHDLIGELVSRRYDVIIMNPPFHQGRASKPHLGQEMIRKAAKALKLGGRLILVANRPLPYEGVLAEVFSSHGETTRDGSFKVLWGRR